MPQDRISMQAVANYLADNISGLDHGQPSAVATGGAIKQDTRNWLNEWISKNDTMSREQLIAELKKIYALATDRNDPNREQI